MDSVNNTSKFGGDAWLELQAFKTRQINRREKLNRHKDLISEISTNRSLQSSTTSSIIPSQNNNSSTTFDINYTCVRGTSAETATATTTITQLATGTATAIATAPPSNNSFSKHPSNEVEYSSSIYYDINSQAYLNLSSSHNQSSRDFNQTQINAYSSKYNTPSELARTVTTPPRTCPDANQNHIDLEVVECLLLLKLCDVALKLPIDSKSLQRFICKVRGLESTPRSVIENLLEKFAHQELITIEEPSAAIINRKQRMNTADNYQDDETCIYVISADHTKLVEFDRTFGSIDSIRALFKESRAEDSISDDYSTTAGRQNTVPIQNIRSVSNHQVKTLERADTSLRSKLEVAPHQTNSCNNEPLKSLLKTTTTNSEHRAPGDDVESLLSLSSTRERESKKLGEELLELLSKPTAKERNLLESFRSADGYQVQEFCPKGTKDECRRNNKETEACKKLHFKKIIAKHTEEFLGDCSFLNTCFHMDSCKYVHYEVDYDDKQLRQRQNTSKRSNTNNPARLFNCPNTDPPVATVSRGRRKKRNNAPNNKEAERKSTSLLAMGSTANKFTLTAEEKLRIESRNQKRFKTILHPPQWIQCDLRYFDMSLLGKFSVVMADPPWDIHMELPYGTMSDDEMRKLNIPALQDEGVIFLWVTGRAMELGRECLALWGYERCDEIIWVKTNQLQRIIRTGRTGHWLNHGKEHCLVGIKGNPNDINRGLDCDIIVAEVRATSHKPDEIYGIIERLSPGTRKIELFGRAHNVQPNWITLGNQLDGVRLVEPNLIEAFKKLDLPFQTSDHVT